MRIGRREIAIIAIVIIAVIVIATVVIFVLPTPEKSLLSWSEANTPNLDPARGSDYSSSVAYVNCYDTLVYPNASGESLPWIATSWTTSSDGLNWTFNLRHNVKFHNGSELKAGDVVFSCERMMTIGEGYSYLFGTMDVNGTTSGWIYKVTAVDDYTVRFDLRKAYGPFLTVLSRLYILDNRTVMANIASGTRNFGSKLDYGMGWLVNHDAGSGPYKVNSTDLPNTVTFEKFTDYWGTFVQNAPDQLKVYGTTTATTIKSMITDRTLEITDQWQTVENLAAMDAISGVDVAKYPAGSILFYMIHNKKAPTDDIHFRKAMAYAMNYTAVVTVLFPGSTIARGPVTSILPGFDPTVPRYDMNLTKAQEELAQSPYYSDLASHPIDVHWCAEVPDEQRVATLFAECMGKINITVNVVQTPWMNMIAEMANETLAPHIETIFVAPHYAEAGSMLESRYHSRSCGTWEQNEWLQNTTLDALIEDAIGTINTTQRFQKYMAIEHQIVDMCPSIFMFEQLEQHAYQSYYVDWPAAKSGAAINSVMGYNLAFKDIKLDLAKKKAGPTAGFSLSMVAEALRLRKLKIN
jgi:peptide/nickel transport system substrate-binding protein